VDNIRRNLLSLLKSHILLRNRNRIFISILFLFYSSIFLGLPAGAEEEVYRRQGNGDWVGQNRPRSVRYAKQTSGNRNETKDDNKDRLCLS
jgi:hypothetical protein